MRRSSDLNRPVLRMSVLSMLSRACHRGCQCIPGLCSGYCRTWVSVVPAVIPPDLPGSGCLYSTGALARRLPRSPITAHCSQEAVLCPLGDFHVHIDFNPDLITAQATFEPALRSKKRRGKKNPRHVFISFFKNPEQRAHYLLFKMTKFSSKTHLIPLWYGRCCYPCLRLSLTPTPASQIASHQMSSHKYQRCCLCWGLQDVFLHPCCSSCKNPFQSQLLFSGTDKWVSVN